MTLSSSTTYRVELSGTTPGNGYDQLNVNGSVTLGSASLSVTSSVVLAGGESFIVINNDGSDAVTGIFSGLPEGAMVTAGTNQLKITYAGGTGNDVVLFRTNAPPSTIQSITVLTNGAVELMGKGMPNLPYRIEAATNLNPVIQWTDLGSALSDGSGTFSFADPDAPLFPMRFYRVLSP